MDWMNPEVSESIEEEEVKMLGLVSSFATRMRKRATSTQGDIALGAEASGGKRPKLTGPDEEALRIPPVINVDSLDRAFDA